MVGISRFSEADSVLSFEFKAWGEGTKGEKAIWDHCRFYLDNRLWKQHRNNANLP